MMQKLSTPRIEYGQSLLGLHLISLLIGYTIIGWLLSLYQAPALIWLGTQAVTVHLAWREKSAIALAMTWVVGVVWIGTLARAYPPSLRFNFQLLVIALFVIWLLGILLALGMALAKQPIQATGLKNTQAFWFLVSLAFSGLAVGRILELMVMG